MGGQDLSARRNARRRDLLPRVRPRRARRVRRGRRPGRALGDVGIRHGHDPAGGRSRSAPSARHASSAWSGTSARSRPASSPTISASRVGSKPAGGRQRWSQPLRRGRRRRAPRGAPRHWVRPALLAPKPFGISYQSMRRDAAISAPSTRTTSVSPSTSKSTIRPTTRTVPTYCASRAKTSM